MSAAPDTRLERVLPTLVYIATHLDADLGLSVLAEREALSPFHFHRLFADTVGETPRSYTERLRLERAAHLLRFTDDAITRIAYRCGFAAPETFSRAFARRFGCPPSRFRREAPAARRPAAADHAANPPGDREAHNANRLARGHELSAVRVTVPARLRVAFIRHLGPYDAVDPAAFDRLARFAGDEGLLTPESTFLGVGHDDPAITPLDRLRYDACVTVGRRIGPAGEIGYQELDLGRCATATYVGPYGPTLVEALVELFRRASSIPGYAVVGLPLVEVYRTTTIRPEYELNTTDIYLPLRATTAAVVM